MNIQRIISICGVLGALVLASGCHAGAELRVPDGFAALESSSSSPYAFRAASADGVVIAVRSEPNRPLGSLAFWSRAVDQKLVSRQYVPEGPARTVKTRSGLVGREIRYTREENGQSLRFWVAVFVTEGRVWLVEAGGESTKLDGKMGASLEEAIASLSIG